MCSSSSFPISALNHVAKPTGHCQLLKKDSAVLLIGFLLNFNGTEYPGGISPREGRLAEFFPHGIQSPIEPRLFFPCRIGEQAALGPVSFGIEVKDRKSNQTKRIVEGNAFEKRCGRVKEGWCGVCRLPEIFLT